MSLKYFITLIALASSTVATAAPVARVDAETSADRDHGTFDARESGNHDVSAEDLTRIGRGEDEENAARIDRARAAMSSARPALSGGRDADIQESASAAFDSTGTLTLGTELDLNAYSGKTFFQAMTGDGGIKDALEADVGHKFKVAGKEAIAAAADSFDPTVYKKVTQLFKDGEDGLGALADALEGQSYNPETIVPAIRAELTKQKLLKDAGKTPLAAVMVAPFLSLASGAGTHVKLDANNSYFNIGYKKGSKDPEVLAKAVKSGRSFGISKSHKALDASDVFYLKELESYLGDAKSPSKFYSTLLDVLTACDTSSLSKLTKDGQSVATDFFAIYTSELDRHAMTGMTQHPWENDLAEVTFLSAYGTAAGKVLKDGELVDGTPKDYFGVSQRGNGSGIGMTRRDRMSLQKKVTKAERAIHPEVVERLETLLGLEAGDDVIHGLMDFLNDAKTQAKVKKNAGEIAEAFGEFLSDIRDDADQITKAIK